ncbi:hypothetical protein PF005_g29368 [Phytophthora fragariae]|uniref:Uncharacterized protein n=1 Tax=Phytophthora fragariae TaxID=53985 RepID=A0A6A4BDC8_9STRA|nr:hypothetical protein PF003_g19288 [Phytophthora fragariae]KAE8920612.1 hypothetical protein PF009_g29097 [Phytophthora fragariae]KAE8966878.1 hypothetical protein PF011_g27774 [Phytophthora fragariae]KAE9066404.1 hypothetical protein PF010_g27824 [Phytophthora fragariae]KAE9066406.1 hypothetical protein PF007_g28487 [Phytophthora fragariae]
MLSPQEINSAASFDPDLVHEVGEPGESTKRIIKMKLQLGLSVVWKEYVSMVGNDKDKHSARICCAAQGRRRWLYEMAALAGSFAYVISRLSLGFTPP